MLLATMLSLLLVQSGQAPPQADAAKKALEQLQGNWRVTSFNGQDAPGGAELFLVIKGDKYEQWTNGTVEEKGALKLDGSTKPMSIDFSITDGNDAGKLQLGLFDLTGDTLSLAFAAPGNPTRPKTPADAELVAILVRSR
jgi:uncharacterized protein (TIGR03067 family)